jgi:hypothetical protein
LYLSTSTHIKIYIVLTSNTRNPKGREMFFQLVSVDSLNATSASTDSSSADSPNTTSNIWVFYNDFSSSANVQNASQTRDPDGLQDRGDYSQMAILTVRFSHHGSMTARSKPKAQPAQCIVMGIIVRGRRSDMSANVCPCRLCRVA